MMVKFTLKDENRQSSIKLDVPDSEEMVEVFYIANDFWDNELILRKGYDLMYEDGVICDTITEGDVIEVVPVPRNLIFQ